MRAVLVAADDDDKPFINLPRGGGKAMRCTLHFGVKRETPSDPRGFSGISLPGCLVLRRAGKLVLNLPRGVKAIRPLITPDIAQALLDQIEMQPVASQIGAGQKEKWDNLMSPRMEPVKFDIREAVS